jgi:hypothetical protein
MESFPAMQLDSALDWQDPAYETSIVFNGSVVTHVSDTLNACNNEIIGYVVRMWVYAERF